MKFEQRLAKDIAYFATEVQLVDEAEALASTLAVLTALDEDDSAIFDDAFPAADRDERPAAAGEAD
ncbi:hypothetical protein ACFWY5_12165 [Nonomuraea sp. NPDC059007]|uniref:hypothetical protein n=1 Tax=Nonomuraea sp. NPDC059007 TaxID=3346692 RepID=UPI003682A859